MDSIVKRRIGKAVKPVVISYVTYFKLKPKSELVEQESFGIVSRKCAALDCDITLFSNKVLCPSHYKQAGIGVIQKLKTFYGLKPKISTHKSKRR